MAYIIDDRALYPNPSTYFLKAQTGEIRKFFMTPTCTPIAKGRFSNRALLPCMRRDQSWPISPVLIFKDQRQADPKTLCTSGIGVRAARPFSAYGMLLPVCHCIEVDLYL